VQWQLNTGSGFTNIGGATSTTLTVTTPLVSATGNLYHAVFTNTCGGTSTATSTAATLTVNPKGLDITANDRTKTYGDAVTFAGTEFTTGAGQLVNGDSVTSVTLTSAGATATATVSGSPYVITPSAAVGTGLDNYTINYHNASVGLTVNPKGLDITANDRTKTYGDAVTFAGTEFTTGAGQLVNGDSVTSVTLTSTGAAAGATVGTYPIVASAAVGTGLSNYTIGYHDGTLTILYSTGACLGSPGHQILQPIDFTGASVFPKKQGSTVPAKFRVCDFTGNSIGTPGVVTDFRIVRIISGTGPTDVNDVVTSTTPDSAFRFDTTAMQWIFNISTKNLSAGYTYYFRVWLNDGSNIDFQFGLK